MALSEAQEGRERKIRSAIKIGSSKRKPGSGRTKKTVQDTRLHDKELEKFSGPNRVGTNYTAIFDAATLRNPGNRNNRFDEDYQAQVEFTDQFTSVGFGNRLVSTRLPGITRFTAGNNQLHDIQGIARRKAATAASFADAASFNADKASFTKIRTSLKSAVSAGGKARAQKQGNQFGLPSNSLTIGA